MADPQAATLTPLRNILARAGKSMAERHAALAASGLLMQPFERGQGGAQAPLRAAIDVAT